MADTHSAHAPAENGAVHHETSDVNIRAIFAFGAALIVVAVAVHFIIWLMFLYFGAREARSEVRQFPLAASEENRLPPEPRLQTNPRQDLKDLRSGEDAILNSYSWVDKNAGVVRIPIGEAMKLTVQRGLPARQANGDKGK
ncbi:MAG TPA: hypothetical protein VG222_00660 [Vicinamibacterales bacterium]|nr:hypothetical protein [Vicinamibacterales bacterium]